MRRDPRRPAALLAGALAVGGWGLGRTAAGPSAAGLVALLVAAASLGRLASDAGWRRPALVLDDEGLHDHASGASVGLVPWGEVAGVSVLVLPGSDLVRLRLRHPDRVLEGLPPWTRAVVSVNRRLLGSPVNIPVAGCAVTTDELVEAVRSRMERAQRAG